MKRFRTISGILGLVVVVLTAISNYAQGAKEPYLQAVQFAGQAMRQKDYDAAIKFYTEAIDLFPKVDAFTPKNKKIKLANGEFEEIPYEGLDSLYSARAKAYLQKDNLDAAEADYMNSLTVIKYKIVGSLENAKKYREDVDISKEKKIGIAGWHNSDLVRAVYAFETVLQLTQKAKWLSYENEIHSNLTIRRLKPTAKTRILAFIEEIIKFNEDAHLGKTEAYATSMIEVGNKAHNFSALKSADDYVAAFPNSIKAYRLRAKIYRHWGREAEALADEQKIKELSGQK